MNTFRTIIVWPAAITGKIRESVTSEPVNDDSFCLSSTLIRRFPEKQLFKYKQKGLSLNNVRSNHLPSIQVRPIQMSGEYEAGQAVNICRSQNKCIMFQWRTKQISGFHTWVSMHRQYISLMRSSMIEQHVIVCP